MQRVKWALTMYLCLATFPAFSQTTTKYQPATITEVAPRATAGDNATTPPTYEISVRVGDMIYVVLYMPPFGTKTVTNIAGRELLVLIGDKTLTYNDILGRSVVVPIISRRPVIQARPTRSADPNEDDLSVIIVTP